MLSEIEIWRSAKLMAAQFGERAIARAAERAAALDSRADVDGWMTWMRIAEAILELQSARPEVPRPVRPIARP